LYLALLDELNGLANLVLAGNCRGFGRGIGVAAASILIL
jgi:hypothetical protein